MEPGGRGPTISDATPHPAREESLKALELILQAWDQGTEDEIAPEMMAYAALFTAMIELVVAFGEDNVARLAEGLVLRIRKGEFSTGTVVH